MVVAGLRFDTGYNDGDSDGPDWSTKMRPGSGYTARHPEGSREAHGPAGAASRPNRRGTMFWLTRKRFSGS